MPLAVEENVGIGDASEDGLDTSLRLLQLFVLPRAFRFGVFGGYAQFVFVRQSFVMQACYKLAIARGYAAHERLDVASAGNPVRLLRAGDFVFLIEIGR